MKKLLIGMLAVLMAFSLTACAWEEDTPDANDDPAQDGQSTIPAVNDENDLQDDNQPVPQVADEPVVDDNEAKMEIAKAQLTPEEQQLYRLLDTKDCSAVYDFTADGQLQKITAYAYELGGDGTWHKISGAGTYFSGAEGRLAISFDLIPDEITLSTQGQEGTNSATHSRADKLDIADMISVTEFAETTNEIIYGEEIPLALQVVSSNQDVVSFRADHFENPEAFLDYGYEHVYALTVTFFGQRRTD